MRLSSLLAVAARTPDNYGRRVRFRLYRGVLHDCEVNSLDYDSRAIRVVDDAISHGGGRSVFFALRGTQTDGERFIEDAIAAGAAVIVCARRRACRRAAVATGVTVIRCRRPQLLMSLFAHLLYGAPSEAMQIVGITGTDGKSTSAYFTYQLLRLLGVRCGIISTVLIDAGEGDGAECNPVHLTTPSAPQLHRALAAMRHAGYTHAIVETSSHALTDETARVAHVRYNGALITNITSEHLEFHRTRRRYRAAKARLLCMLRPSPLLSSVPPFALSAAAPAVQRYLQRRWRRCRAAPLKMAQAAGGDHPTVGRSLAAAGTKRVRMRPLISYRIDEHGSDAAALATDGIHTTAPIAHHSRQQEAFADVAPHNAIHAVVVDHSIDGVSVRIIAADFARSGKAVRERETQSIPESVARERDASLTGVPETAGTGQVMATGMPADAAPIEVRAPFCGVYNAENLLGALCCTHLLTSRPLADLAPLAERIALPPGRLQQVSDPQRHPYRVFVDYAHTAASLEAVLQLFRPLTDGRLVVLFGSAGMRDREKRGEMGSVAAEHADIIYLTNEDPREEPPQAIVDEIMRGIHSRATAPRQPQTYIILDREQAIATAVARLKPNDTLLLLGKGHEQSMISSEGESPWDEAEVARRYLGRP